jgi:hypothetical protein
VKLAGTCGRAGQPVEITRVRRIPARVLRPFGFETRLFGLPGTTDLADPGEDWNSSDFFGAEDDRPHRALIFAARTRRIWLLHFMSGGFSLRMPLLGLCADGGATKPFRIRPDRGPWFHSLGSLQQELQPDRIELEERR